MKTWQVLKDPAEGYIVGNGYSKWRLDAEYLWILVYEADKRNKFAKEYVKYPIACPQAILYDTSKESAYGIIDLYWLDFYNAVSSEMMHTIGIDGFNDPNKIKLKYWRIY